MKKRKSPKHNDPLMQSFLQNAPSDMVMEDVDYVDQSMESMVSSVIHNAMELSKLVIENRVRKSENIKDEDIYNIYTKSLNVVLTSVGNSNQN